MLDPRLRCTEPRRLLWRALHRRKRYP